MKIGNKIELNKRPEHTNAAEDEQTTYVSQILDFKEGELIAAMPIYEGHIIPLEVGGILETYFYTERGIFRSDCCVTGRGKEENIYVMSLERTTELKKFQRRQFYRLPCSIEALVRPLHAVDVMQYSKTKVFPVMEEAVDEKGMIVDISGGGVRIMSGEKFEKNDFVMLRFPIEMNIGTRWIQTMGRVVASYQSQNRSDLYDNRVQFKEIRRELRESIVKYIFEQQRKIRQKERG